MSEIIINWAKKNSWWLSFLLLGLALLLLIYIAIKVPTKCHSCMNNPIRYYEAVKNTSCFCENMQFIRG